MSLNADQAQILAKLKLELESAANASTQSLYTRDTQRRQVQDEKNAKNKQEFNKQGGIASQIADMKRKLSSSAAGYNTLSLNIQELLDSVLLSWKGIHADPNSRINVCYQWLSALSQFGADRLYGRVVGSQSTLNIVENPDDSSQYLVTLNRSGYWDNEISTADKEAINTELTNAFNRLDQKTQEKIVKNHTVDPVAAAAFVRNQ